MANRLEVNLRKILPYLRRIISHLWWIIPGVLIVSLWQGYISLTRDLPDISQIDTYRPSLASRLFDRNGREFAQLAVEKRILVSFRDIPLQLKQAVVAVEDSRFYEHNGVDWQGILRAAVRNVLAGRIKEGGSTLTQQLARALFLSTKKTIIRKIQEIFLALRIEHRYSKDEILELYLNQVYFGHGVYGVQSAAHYYFDKPVKDLNLVECAMLAGLPKSPNSYAPDTHPDPARSRREHVLGRMRETGYISVEQYQDAIESELVLAKREERQQAPYFVEMIRREMEKKYGSMAVYQEGFNIYTTLDVDLQAKAETALERGLIEVDKRQGYRPLAPDTVLSPAVLSPKEGEKLKLNALYVGIVKSVAADELKVQVGGHLGAIAKPEMEWATGSKSPASLFKPEQKILVRVVAPGFIPGKSSAGQAPALRRAEGEPDPVYKLSLEQEPQVQGAIIVLDVPTANILAMSGGYSFGLSKYNRAVQAHRQPGSSFKPIVYAAALQRGFTLAEVVLDAPSVYQGISADEDWRPANYKQEFFGPNTLRTAMEHSRNASTLRLLEKLGIAPAIRMAKNLGISSKLDNNLSLGLGSTSISLMELAGAYNVFANNGKRLEPLSIRRISGHAGNILEESSLTVRQAIPPEEAYLMTSLQQSTTRRGI